MRIPLLWLWRLLLGGFAIAYLSSATLQSWLPPLLPFLAAAAVEAQFFVAGLRRGATRTDTAGRGPQERDLAEFGWANRTVTVRSDEAELVLRPGEMTDAEIVDWLELHDAELAALGPGRHELAPIGGSDSPVTRHVAPPARAPERKSRRRLLQALLVLALLAAAFAVDELQPGWRHLSASTKAGTIARLERAASRIAGHPATVICDTGGHHVGYVQDANGLAEVGGRRMWLTPEICYRLYRIAKTGRSAGAPSGEAIAVFAHEAWHLHGQSSEAIANCYAYQSGVSVGEALGLEPGTARGLMQEQLAENPADFADARQYLAPPGCRRGGELDLRLDGSHFP